MDLSICLSEKMKCPHSLYQSPRTLTAEDVSNIRTRFRPSVSMRWEEIAVIARHRDMVVLSGQSGDKIRTSAFQVGADELFTEIWQHTGTRVRLL